MLVNYLEVYNYLEVCNTTLMLQTLKKKKCYRKNLHIVTLTYKKTYMGIIYISYIQSMIKPIEYKWFAYGYSEF